MDQKELLNAFDHLQNLVENPDIFVEKHSDYSTQLKNHTKSFYDYIKSSTVSLDSKQRSLPKLLLKNFDDEQVWGQIDLHNSNAISHFKNTSTKIDFNNCLTFDISETNEDKKVVPEDEESGFSDSDDDSDLYDDNDEEIENDADFNNSNQREDEQSEDEHLNDEDDAFHQDDSDDDELELSDTTPKKKSSKSKKHLNDDEEDDFDQNDGDDDESELSDSTPKKTSSKSKELRYQSELDDKFFNESKMRNFLKVEDLKEEKMEQENDSEEDDDIDLFQEDTEEPCDLMYKDFFDDPDSENDKEQDESDVSMNEEDKDSFNEEESDEDKFNEGEIHEEEKNADEHESAPNQDQEKTPFQLQQEKVQKQIAEYEGSMLEPQSWHLTGEVDAMTRPKEALLNLDTDFDMNAKPVIIEDQDLCKKLESMIIMTIKNKAYSDGVKQYKTNDEIIAYKKEVLLEQTKSKKSLAQEYEDIYLKKQMTQQEEENPKHEEIKKFMDSLFPDLHALFSHIPKPAIPDIKIVSNMPAVTVEDVAPTSVSDLTLLAPEEIKKRTGLVKGQSERTVEDRKRERRKKKIHQRVEYKKREAKEGTEGQTARTRKHEKLDLVRKLKQNRNTKIATGQEKIKSSKQFFERLQEKVDTKKPHVKKKQ